MKTDYKRLYENASYMLTKYQDEIVPGLRASLEAAEAQIAELNENADETAKECARLERRIKSMKKRFRPVVYGRWVENDDGWGGVYYTCTACGEDWTTVDGTPMENNMNFCPKCGAMMRNDGK